MDTTLYRYVPFTKPRTSFESLSKAKFPAAIKYFQEKGCDRAILGRDTSARKLFLVLNCDEKTGVVETRIPRIEDLTENDQEIISKFEVLDPKTYELETEAASLDDTFHYLDQLLSTFGRGYVKLVESSRAGKQPLKRNLLDKRMKAGNRASLGDAHKIFGNDVLRIGYRDDEHFIRSGNIEFTEEIDLPETKINLLAHQARKGFLIQ